MTNDAAPVSLPDGGPIVPKKKRRWPRYLYQFSLRTLLVAMTVAAAGCWWFLQPETSDEELAGKQLRLRRQVRTISADQITGWMGVADDNGMVVINDGYWRLIDEYGGLLVDGHQQRSVPQGPWKTYHANGQLAVEGTVVRGLRSGLWRVWDEQGRLRSETTYRVADGAFSRSYPRPSMAGAGSGYGTVMIPGSNLSIRGGPGQFVHPQRPPEGSLRHGPARAWHASGELRLAGSYQDDLRTGEWAFYDAEGRLTARGSYERGERVGLWMLRDVATGEERQERYLDGLPEERHARLLAQHRLDLESDDPVRQYAAVVGLGRLGDSGVAMLGETLDSPHERVQFLALRGLVRSRQPLGDWMPAMARLIDHENDAVARWSMLAVYLHEPRRRSELFTRLVEKIRTLDVVAVQIEMLGRMSEPTGPHQIDAFAELLEVIAEERLLLNGVLAQDDPNVFHFQLDLPRLLVASYQSPNARVRFAAVAIVDEIVQRGEPTLVQADAIWPIPPEYQPMIEVAKNDPDAEVRALAEQVGKHSNVGGFF